MRHHGVPTRLLDWTESVCVAVFFDAWNHPKAVAGVVWMLSPGHLNQDSIGDIIPFLTDDRVSSLAKSAFSGRGNVTDTVAVLAPRSNPRMAAKLGAYTIHGSRQPLEAHRRAATFLAKVEIPDSAMYPIRRDLSLAGVRLSNLFPDLDHLAEELCEMPAIGPDGQDITSG